MAVAAVDVADRDHVDLAARAVDAAAFLFELGADRLVAVDILAAGRRDLDEDQVLHPFGMLVEEAPDSVDALGNALRIVEPVDPDHGGASAR